MLTVFQTLLYEPRNSKRDYHRKEENRRKFVNFILRQTRNLRIRTEDNSESSNSDESYGTESESASSSSHSQSHSEGASVALRAAPPPANPRFDPIDPKNSSPSPEPSFSSHSSDDDDHGVADADDRLACAQSLATIATSMPSLATLVPDVQRVLSPTSSQRLADIELPGRNDEHYEKIAQTCVKVSVRGEVGGVLVQVLARS